MPFSLRVENILEDFSKSEPTHRLDWRGLIPKNATSGNILSLSIKDSQFQISGIHAPGAKKILDQGLTLLFQHTGFNLNAMV